MELAQYTVKPSLTRLLVPQFFKLIALCGMFYGGIIINLNLLGTSMPLIGDVLTIMVLLLLLIAQIFITKKKSANFEYQFFSNRIDYFGERLNSVLYSSVENVDVKRNIFDYFSGTATIALTKDFKLNYVSNYGEVADYIRKLVQSSRYQQVQATYTGAY